MKTTVDERPDPADKFSGADVFGRMASYQIRTILLLTVVVTNIQLNMAVFDPMESQEDMETLPSCFRRGYTVRVHQKDSEGRTCWDIITVSSCWGRCHSNEVTITVTVIYAS